MAASDSLVPLDWHRVLWSEEAPPAFLLEVVFRCVATYLLILITLRITGRRQVKQLSMFELSLVLALGSAAGDAMFYPDVPMMHIVVVFGVVLVLYLLFNLLTEAYPRFSDWLEGKAACILDDGVIRIPILNRHKLTQKELFGELRQLQVEHLGQVRRIYLEATGNISVFFFADEDVRPGLPIFPEILATSQRRVEQAGDYACSTCGHVMARARGQQQTCPQCQQDCWVMACPDKRVK